MTNQPNTPNQQPNQPKREADQEMAEKPQPERQEQGAPQRASENR